MPDSQKSIAIVGTRGIPARYGGFETLAEELAPRLARRGHDVCVYSRRHAIGPLPEPPEDGVYAYKGVGVRVLRAPRQKHLETVVHSFLSAADAWPRRFDSVLLCNAANALVIPMLRMRGCRVVVNVDGLEWRRKKWGKVARTWHKTGARLTARWADEIIADAHFVRRYWEERMGTAATYIPYGAPDGPVETTAALESLGLKQRQYVLYVGRLEPENNPDLVIEAFRRVQSDFPLVVVGQAPYAISLRERLESLARRDTRVMLPGPVYGKGYAELQSHAACYVQASEIGGTHPALLEAMAYGGCVVVNDIPEHIEVVEDTALAFEFNDGASLARCIQRTLDEPELAERMRIASRTRVQSCYSWQVVAAAYEAALCGDGR
jgi:glycosyltransferase involved in cell wall biosynthesis